MISVGHAKVILGVEDTLLQEQLCDAVVREDLSVRALEQLLAKGAKPAEKKKADIQQDLPENYYKVLERVGKYFGENISLKRNKGGKGELISSLATAGRSFGDTFGYGAGAPRRGHP